jgi:hypothetical protein
LKQKYHTWISILTMRFVRFASVCHYEIQWAICKVPEI